MKTTTQKTPRRLLMPLLIAWLAWAALPGKAAEGIDFVGPRRPTRIANRSYGTLLTISGSDIPQGASWSIYGLSPGYPAAGWDILFGPYAGDSNVLLIAYDGFPFGESIPPGFYRPLRIAWIEIATYGTPGQTGRRRYQFIVPRIDGIGLDTWNVAVTFEELLRKERISAAIRAAFSARLREGGRVRVRPPAVTIGVRG